MDPLESAEDEWAQVAEIVPTFKAANDAEDEDGPGADMPEPRAAPQPRETPLLTVERAIEHFRTTITEKTNLLRTEETLPVDRERADFMFVE